MSIPCGARLTDTPNYQECSCERCEFCHEGHTQDGGWRVWNIYPECWRCEEEMLEEIGQILLPEQISESEPIRRFA